MGEALVHQQARRLAAAEHAYRAALALNPDEPDALHMLGVIRYERDDLAEARELIVRALDLTGWRIPEIRQNLGLVLAKWAAAPEISATAALRGRYDGYVAARRERRHAADPLVSVVMPSFNHARYVAAALRSVFEQSYRNVEIVVIDDGSSDASPSLIADALRDSPFPQRFVVRANRGAPATLNEGAALARGDYLQFLNSDDWLAPSRIARMVEEVANVGSAWGFSSVAMHDGEDAPIDLMLDRRAYDIACALARIPLRATVSRAFITDNVAVSTGNLFVARSFFDRLGGFRDFRYNHDWDFCLRAIKLEEPVYLPESLYGYRLHGSNTITESGERAFIEARTVCTEYLAWARSELHPANPFAPAVSTWGPTFINIVLDGGMGGIIDAAALRELALA
jgi:glycosyltransferase involved in cell wall biosynthesis